MRIDLTWRPIIPQVRASKLQPMGQIPPLGFVEVKVYWTIVVPIYLHMIYGCFQKTMAELSSSDGDHMARMPKIFIIWPITENIC